MKKSTQVLRTILVLIGIVLFVFATVGESVERANWTAISSFADELAEEQGFDSYDAIEDEAVKASIKEQALVLAAQETAAVNRGYKKFSKVKDEAEIEEIKAEAIEIAEAKKNESGFGVALAST